MKPLRFPFAVTLAGATACILAQALSAETNLTYPSATKNQVADSFWKPLLDRNRAITIPHNLRMCHEMGIVANFERVAGLREGDYHGLPNWDEFLYKAIEAACYGLRQRPDPELEKKLDDLIAVLARAQDADGYLRTVIHTRAVRTRWIIVSIRPNCGVSWQTLSRLEMAGNAFWLVALLPDWGVRLVLNWCRFGPTQVQMQSNSPLTMSSALLE